jgi:hypothetical protein
MACKGGPVAPTVRCVSCISVCVRERARLCLCQHPLFSQRASHWSGAVQWLLSGGKHGDMVSQTSVLHLPQNDTTIRTAATATVAGGRPMRRPSSSTPRPCSPSSTRSAGGPFRTSVSFAWFVALFALCGASPCPFLRVAL